jgi:hypothetical protein
MENVPAEPLPVEKALVDSAWHLDPKVTEQVEETLSTLTLRRRRFLKHYLESGSIGGSVRQAGYNVTTSRSATEVGRSLLKDPRVEFCVQAILEAEGIGSGAKLRSVIGQHMARFDSPDGGDRDRSLRAASLVYKLAHRAVPPAANRNGYAGGVGSVDYLLDQMSPAELERFADHRVWPARFARYLRATAATDPPLSATPDGPAGGVQIPVPEAPAGAASRTSVDDAPLPSDDVHSYRDRAPIEAPEAARAAGRGAEPLSPFEHHREALARAERELKAATAPPLDPELRSMAIRDRRW